MTTAGRRFIDGGVRSPVNADLAAGFPRVVVIAPVVRGIGPLVGVDAQVAALRADGSRVTVVSPDAAAVTAIGRNVLDPARRAPSAQARRAQAPAAADAVAEVWSS